MNYPPPSFGSVNPSYSDGLSRCQRSNKVATDTTGSKNHTPPTQQIREKKKNLNSTNNYDEKLKELPALSLGIIE